MCGFAVAVQVRKGSGGIVDVVVVAMDVVVVGAASSSWVVRRPAQVRPADRDRLGRRARAGAQRDDDSRIAGSSRVGTVARGVPYSLYRLEVLSSRGSIEPGDTVSVMSYASRILRPASMAGLPIRAAHGVANAGVVIADDGLTVIDTTTTPQQVAPLAHSSRR